MADKIQPLTSCSRVEDTAVAGSALPFHPDLGRRPKRMPFEVWQLAKQGQ
jgi:hypothetical protein